MCQVGQLGHVNDKEGQALKQTSSPCAEMGSSELMNFSKDILTTIPLAALICSRLSHG